MTLLFKTLNVMVKTKELKPSGSGSSKGSTAQQPNVSFEVKAGKGHRQRGAGTVITAKPPVVTSDGVVLKAHERLPIQLLHEYCQREKRPSPKYIPSPPGRRFNVILEDSKNSKYDLAFCPVQSVDSDAIAKDYAALLALFHFQKTLPLERKLPEPYSTTWLQMLSKEKEKSVSAKSEKVSSDKSSVPAPTDSVAVNSSKNAQQNTSNTQLSKLEESSSSLKKSSLSTAAVIDPSTADWLCEKCGNQNFNKLQSGALRSKCYRCSAPRTEACILVTPNVLPPPSIVATAGTKVQAGEPTVSNKVKKIAAAPAAVIDLRAKDSFASKAAKSREDLENIAKKNRRRAYFAALDRANRPMVVFLSRTLRKELERVLGLEVDNDASAATFVGSVQDFLEDFVGVGFIPPSVCKVSASLQLELLQEIVASLVHRGFIESDILRSLMHVNSSSGVDLAEDFDTCSDEEIGDGFEESVDESENIDRFNLLLTEAVVKQLCRSLDENSLPAEFNPKSNEARPGLEVIPGSSKVKALQTVDYTSDPLVREYRDLFDDGMKFGWSVNDISSVISIVLDLLAPVRPPVDAIKVSCLYLLLNATKDCFQLSTSGFSNEARTIWCSSNDEAVDGSPPSFDNDILREECESLVAILDDRISVSSTGQFTHVSIQIDVDMDLDSTGLSRIQQVHLSCMMEVFIPSALPYPDAEPLVLIRPLQPEKHSISGQNLLHLQLLLWKKSIDLRGEQMLFQLYGFAQDGFKGVDEQLVNNFKDVSLESALQKAIANIKGRLFDDQSEEDAQFLNHEKISSNDDEPENSSSTKIDGETLTHDKDVAVLNGTRGKSRGLHPFWRRLHQSQMVRPGGGGALNPNSLKGRQNLPAWNCRDEFLGLYSQHRALVVTGETGCGKTTQIPQFIFESNPNAKIVICQPRRLAAVGVAMRIADEMGSAVGEGPVGYMVKGDSKVSNQARIVLCTYGVLLRRLQDDPCLEAIDCVILDEVHERGIDSDFSLALLMSAMKGRSSLKIILMSATISTDKFARYLDFQLLVTTSTSSSSGTTCSGDRGTPSSSARTPVLFIPGFTYPVTEYFKGDFEDIVRSFSMNTRTTHREGREDGGGDGDDRLPTHYLFKKRKGDVDYELIVKLILRLLTSAPTKSAPEQEDMLKPAEGCILVFMPGVAEINKVITAIRSYDVHSLKKKVKLLALHGNLSPSEQRNVFSLAGRNEVKVVVSTNVAEASVTIPDVSVVIDSCRVKEMGFDSETLTSGLMMKFAAKDSLTQRRGRAGRVQSGRCFRVITRVTYDKLPENSLPEILRTPLDSLVLQVKAMQSEPGHSAYDLLMNCVDPPTEAAVHVAEVYLQQIQALNLSRTGLLGLTPLGRHLAALPCSPQIGRMLVYGCLLSCIHPLSCVAAYMMYGRGGGFFSMTAEASRVEAAKEYFLKGAKVKSDYTVLVNAMAQFNAAANKRKFCQDHSLSLEKMTESKQSQGELLQALVDSGFLRSVQEGLSLSDSKVNRNASSHKIVAAAYFAGLYPQLAKILRPPSKFIEVMGGNIEKELEASELKFYIPEMQQLDDGGGIGVYSLPSSDRDDANYSTSGLQRVFLHSSSINYSNASFRGSNFLLYGERQRMVVHSSSGPNPNYKIILRDVTEVSAFALLFFGGRLESKFLDGTILVDGWIRLSAPGRIVALVEAARAELDKLLLRKISQPDTDLLSSDLLKIISILFETDGLG